MPNDKTYEVFVNQGNSLTDGWSNPLTASQTRVKLNALIAGKITDMNVDIPEDILAQFKDMHWCFPRSVVSIENGHSSGHLDGHFEYFEGNAEDEDNPHGIWKISVEWEDCEHKKSVTLKEMTEDVLMTLQKFSAIMHIAVEGVKQGPTLEEINKKMWALVPKEGDTH